MNDTARRILDSRMFRWLHAARGLLSLALDQLYDFGRYSRHARLAGIPRNKKQYEAELTALYHGLEKGFCMPEPRKLFGRDRIEKLLARIDTLGGTYGHTESADVALRVLATYLSFHEQRGWSGAYLSGLEKRLDRLKRALGSSVLPSLPEKIRLMTRAEAYASSAFDFTRFLQSRRSVRTYADATVDIEIIKEAVALAQMSPSVCNRQSTRVHVLLDQELMRSALSLQNGNRGFGDAIPCVLVITSDLSAFSNAAERYQVWIDAGMFAMTLVYALHAKGMGTCCLNWSVNSRTDRRLRRAISIPDPENVVMMMSVGHLREEFVVCQSPRKAAEEALVIHRAR